MVFLLEALVGGYFVSYAAAWLVEIFAFRNLPPTARATTTYAVAWLLVCIGCGFGFANGGPFAWWIGFMCLPGAVIAWFFHWRKLVKAWRQDSEAMACD